MRTLILGGGDEAALLVTIWGGSSLVNTASVDATYCSDWSFFMKGCANAVSKLVKDSGRTHIDVSASLANIVVSDDDPLRMETERDASGATRL